MLWVHASLLIAQDPENQSAMGWSMWLLRSGCQCAKDCLLSRRTRSTWTCVPWRFQLCSPEHYCAGVEGTVIAGKLLEKSDEEALGGRLGYNAATDTFEDLVAVGVIDPVKVACYPTRP